MRNSVRNGLVRKQAKNARIMREAKDRPCVDCHVQYSHWIMEFDHVRGEKIKNVACMLRSTERQLREEIAKCDIVCANCHRNRTWQRKQ